MRLISILGLLLIVACGNVQANAVDAAASSIDAPAATIDAAASTIDAPGAIDAHPAIDAQPGACTIAASVSMISTSLSGTLYCVNSSGTQVTCPVLDPAAAKMVVVLGAFNDDALPDALSIQLYQGFGEFTTAITTGTFDLASGVDTNYATCASCLLGYGDTSSGGAGDPYFQTGGTLTINSLDAGATSGTITGTVSGLTLTHVSIATSTFQSTPLGDGCDVAVADFSFTANLTDAAGG
jgi:hypothetical protein